jgi:hypothetical protein
MSADFPYRTLMDHPAWGVIDSALGDLETNNDLQLQTARRYVIGYLIEQLATEGLIPPAIAFRPNAPDSSGPRYSWILRIEGFAQGTRQKQSKRVAAARPKHQATG